MNIYISKRLAETPYFVRQRKVSKYPILNKIFIRSKSFMNFSQIIDHVQIVDVNENFCEGILLDYINIEADLNTISIKEIPQIIVLSSDIYNTLLGVCFSLEKILTDDYLDLYNTHSAINYLSRYVYLLELKRESGIVFVKGENDGKNSVLNDNVMPSRILKALIAFADDELEVKLKKELRGVLINQKGKIYSSGVNINDLNNDVFEYLKMTDSEYVNSKEMPYYGKCSDDYIYNYVLNNKSYNIF